MDGLSNQPHSSKVSAGGVDGHVLCGDRFAVFVKTGWEYEQKKKLTNSLNAKNTYEYRVLLFFYSYGSATQNSMCESPHDSFGNNRKIVSQSLRIIAEILPESH